MNHSYTLPIKGANGRRNVSKPNHTKDKWLVNKQIEFLTS